MADGPTRFYFYDLPDAPSAAARGVGLSRRASISGATLLAAIGGAPGASLPHAPNQRVLRRASMIGAVGFDHQEKASGITDADKWIQDYIRGTSKEIPAYSRFVNTLRLNGMDLDTVLIKERDAISRLEALLENASDAEAVDLSYNNLGARWLGSVLQLMEEHCKAKLTRLDLTGNPIVDAVGDEIEPLQREPEVQPPFPQPLMHRRNMMRNSLRLGDFFDLVDLEEARRHSLRDNPALQAPWKGSAQLAEAEAKGVAQQGPQGKSRKDLSQHEVVNKATYGCLVLRNFLRRMSGSQMSAAVLTKMLKTKRPGSRRRVISSDWVGGIAPRATSAESGEAPVMPPLEEAQVLAQPPSECRLESINFKSTGMVADSIIILAEGFFCCPSLVEIDLSQNMLGKDAGLALAALITACPNLKALSLAWCELTTEAVQSMVDAMIQGNEGGNGPVHGLEALDISHNPLGGPPCPTRLVASHLPLSILLFFQGPMVPSRWGRF